MPKAIEGINWDTIALEYGMGATSFELAEKYGLNPITIRQRATRKGWSHTQVKTRLEASQAPSTNTDTQNNQNASQSIVAPKNGVVTEHRAHVTDLILIAKNALEEKKNEFLASGAALATSTMRKLSDEAQPLDAVSSAKLAMMAEGALKIGKTVFGLGDGTSVQLGFQINILSELPAEKDDAIDV